MVVSARSPMQKPSKSLDGKEADGYFEGSYLRRRSCSRYGVSPRLRLTDWVSAVW